MGKRHGGWIFASAVITACATAIIAAAQIPYSVARSNLASWAEGLGLTLLASKLPADADTWATAFGAVAILGAFGFVGLHVAAIVRERNGNEFSKRLTRGKWILHFNPKGGYSKPVTFLTDGSIGEGRNQNEWRWTADGNILTIWRQDGSLQNRFKCAGSPDEFLSVDDPSAKGIRNQRIVRA